MDLDGDDPRDDARAYVRSWAERAGASREFIDHTIEVLEQLPELVGRSQTAEILGVGTTNLGRQFPDLPEPEQRIGARPVWRRSTIEQYAATHAAQ